MNVVRDGREGSPAQPSGEGVGTARHTHGEAGQGRGWRVCQAEGTAWDGCSLWVHACAWVCLRVHLRMYMRVYVWCTWVGVCSGAGARSKPLSLTNTLFTTCPLALPRVSPSESLLLNWRCVLWVTFSPSPLPGQVPPLCPSALQTSHC